MGVTRRVRSTIAQFRRAHYASRHYAIARYAIAQTGRYYKDKDDDANPFVVNDAEMFQFVVGYNPEPVPAGPTGLCKLRQRNGPRPIFYGAAQGKCASSPFTLVVHAASVYRYSPHSLRDSEVVCTTGCV